MVKTANNYVRRLFFIVVPSYLGIISLNYALILVKYSNTHEIIKYIYFIYNVNTDQHPGSKVSDFVYFTFSLHIWHLYLPAFRTSLLR